MALDWELLFKDFQQKYEDTFCYVSIEGNQPELCQIKNIEKTGGAPSIHIYSENVGDILLKYDTSYSDIDFRYPEIGLFEFQKQVLYIHKLHNRQWKKGPGFQTLQVSNLYKPFGGFSPKLNLELMKAALAPRLSISIDQGLYKLNTDAYLSVALSSEFAIGLSTTNQTNPLFWYMNHPIGVIDGFKIVLNAKMFYQEVVDYLSKYSYEYSINL
jgi:hypothetical protein